MKPLPANIDAEIAILGSLLIDPGTVENIRPFLKPDHFYDTRHQWIYQAILDMSANGTPADLVTLPDTLEARQQLDEIGGVGFIMDLINGVPTSTHAEYYAEIVVKLAGDRQAIRLAQQIAERAYLAQGQGLDFASTLIRDASSAFSQITSEGPRFLDDVMNDMVKKAGEMWQAREAGELVDIKLPWQDLTEILGGGLLPGDLVLVVGEPSVGKSTFVHQVGDHAAMFGNGVLVFTTETRPDNFAARQLAPRAGVPIRSLLSGNISPADWDSVFQNITKVRRDGVMLDSIFDAQAFERHIQQARAALDQRGIDLRVVVFDYLQQFRDSRYKDRRVEIGAVINQIRELMVRYGLTGIVVSELDKGSYKNGGKAHIFGSKESGSIEYAATIGIALYRNDEGRVVCDVQKNKDGARRKFILPPMASNAAWFGSARPYTVISNNP